MSNEKRPDDILNRAGFTGSLFRQAREARGLSISAAAKHLNLSQKSIESIENDEINKLPSIVFARGYIRGYCKLLELDPQEQIDLFNERYAERSSSRLSSAFSHTNSDGKLTSPRMVSIALALLVVLGGVFVFLWWQQQNVPLTTEQSSTPAQDDSIAVEGVDGNTLELPVVDEPEVQDTMIIESIAGTEEPDQESYLTEGEVASLNSQSALTQEDNTSPTSPESTNPTETAATANETAISGVENTVATTSDAGSNDPQSLFLARIQANFSADCWVTVRDANGETLISEVKRAGETLAITGKPPLRVLLGAATAVADFKFNNQTINIEPYKRRNVVRMTLPL